MPNIWPDVGSEPMNRRDFLDPRRLAQPAGSLLDALEANPQTAEADAAPVHLRFGRRAMATTFEVILPFGTPDAHQVALDALDEIDRLEDQLPVYPATSEATRPTAPASPHPVPAEQVLFDLLLLAHRLPD